MRNFAARLNLLRIKVLHLVLILFSGSYDPITPSPPVFQSGEDGGSRGKPEGEKFVMIKARGRRG